MPAGAICTKVAATGGGATIRNAQAPTRLTDIAVCLACRRRRAAVPGTTLYGGRGGAIKTGWRYNPPVSPGSSQRGEHRGEHDNGPRPRDREDREPGGSVRR